MVNDIEPGALGRLLDLQEEDSAIARLDHRRETLPEGQRLAELNAQLAELTSDLEIATKQAEEAAREQDRIEGEIGLITQKIEREEQRMFSGGVSNPKELGALQAEVESLKRKRSSMEDGLLEVMEQREQADGTKDRITQERDQISTEAAQLTKVVEAIMNEIALERDAHGKKRAEVAATIPEELTRLYDQLREQKGGVGAAHLEGDVCSACHTKLPSQEVERLRAASGVQRCDNCRRILVV